MRARSSEPLDRFIENNPDAKMDGFYWRDPLTGEFCVVVLAKVKKKTTAQEFHGTTPEELIETVAMSNADCGEPEQVRQLCESSPRWLSRPKRGRPSAPPAGTGGG